MINKKSKNKSKNNKTGILNNENAIMNISNSNICLVDRNYMFNNFGSLTLTNNTNIGNTSHHFVYNHESGTVVVDGGTYATYGNGWYGMYFLYNEKGTATIKNMNSSIASSYNYGTLTLSENNNLTGNLYNEETGLLIIDGGTYNNIFYN